MQSKASGKVKLRILIMYVAVRIQQKEKGGRTIRSEGVKQKIGREIGLLYICGI